MLRATNTQEVVAHACNPSYLGGQEGLAFEENLGKYAQNKYL
jgi:hypothetical protein